MKSQFIIYLGAIFLLLSCNNNNQIAVAGDYQQELEQQPKVLDWIAKDLQFWEQKAVQHPNQFPYKAKLAAAYGTVFSTTQDIAALNKANALWDQVNQTTSFKNAGYLRAAARLAITAHEFKKAHNLLKLAEDSGQRLQDTQKMLFDVCMELGFYQEAKLYLDTVKDFTDVDYLIRRSKWEDYLGNLPEAISFLERVLEIAYSNNNTSLQLWSITNLADYYGHAGTVLKSYNNYLNALALDPENKYAKKGIAYIAFAKDNNPTEAIRIMEAITRQHRTPDDLLFLADLYQATGNFKAQKESLSAFRILLESGQYGALYNIPLAMLWAEEDKEFSKAIALLKHEVARRATPETYSALAYVYLLSGDATKALNLAQEFVIGQSSEPVLLLQTAAILKANGITNQALELKAELMEAAFELGPAAMQHVKAL